MAEPNESGNTCACGEANASNAAPGTALAAVKEPLTLPNLFKTLWLGFFVLCGEWRWLISDSWYRRKEKALLNELARLPHGPDADRVQATLINQRSLHHGMRQAQLISRERYLKGRP